MPELRAVSGVGSKGPACFLLRLGGRNLLLDLGRGPDNDRLPDISGLPQIDAVLFSHGHADHTGGLVLWQALGQPPLYATAPTIALSELPALRQARPLENQTDIMGLPVLTGPAGHAPGAVWMRIGGEDGLLYTGDTSAGSLMFRHKQPPRAAAMVLDASYGTARETLTGQVADICKAGSGPVLFPCPAGGRGLEVALTFLRLGHEVSICPAHRRVAKEMARHANWLTPGGRDGLALLDEATELTETAPLQGVMVAAGANAERGVAQALARRIGSEGGAQIVFTGHVPPGSAAATLIADGQAVFRRWNVHPDFAEAEGLVAAVSPRTMLAAFCDAQAVAELRAQSGWPISDDERLVW